MTPVLEGTVVRSSGVRRLFGRDPSLIASAIGGIVAFLGLAVFNWPGDLIGGVNAGVAALLAVYVAWGTVDKTTSALIQLLKAGVFLAVTFGAKISADQTALAIIALEGVIGAWTRTQVTAIEPGPTSPAAPGTVPVTVVSDRGAFDRGLAVTIAALLFALVCIVWLVGHVDLHG